MLPVFFIDTANNAIINGINFDFWTDAYALNFLGKIYFLGSILSFLGKTPFFGVILIPAFLSAANLLFHLIVPLILSLIFPNASFADFSYTQFIFYSILYMAYGALFIPFWQSIKAVIYAKLQTSNN